MTRSTRRHPATAEPDDAELSKLESLLLAQAVYESGANAWATVSKILSKSNLISRPKSFFTPSACQSMYAALMNTANFPISEQSNHVHAPANRKLAERHFSERLNELRDLISEEESKFKAILNEIQTIQAGTWDDKIKTDITGIKVTSGHSPFQDPQVSYNEPSDSKPQDQPQANIQDQPPANELTARRSTRSTTSLQPVTRTTRARKQQKSEHPQTEGDTENETVDDKTDPGTPLIPLSRSTSPAAFRKAEKRRATDTIDSPRERKRQREESEPVEEEDQPGPSAGTRRRRDRAQPTEEQVASRKFQNVIQLLLSQISTHRNGNIFHNPIKDSEAPDYSEIIKRPMDLKTIKARIKDGLISNSLDFQRDIYLMFANALMYNRPGSDVYTMAEDMMSESEAQIISFRQTEGLVRGGNRRA